MGKPLQLCMKSAHEDFPLATAALLSHLHLNTPETLSVIERLLRLPYASSQLENLSRSHVEFHVHVFPAHFSSSGTFRHYLSTVDLPPGTVWYVAREAPPDLPRFRYRRSPVLNGPAISATFTGYPLGMTLSTDPKEDEYLRFFSGGKELNPDRTFYRFR